MTRLSDEAKLHMLRKAGATERRNRPTWMPRLGVLLVIIASVYALLGWNAQRAAHRELRSTQAGDTRLTATLDEITQLRDSPNQGGPEVFEPIAGPQTSMESAAVAVGLDAPAPPSQSSDQVGSGISRKIYFYKDVRHGSAEALFEWLVEVERTIDGMRVHSLDLRTVGETGWLMDVRFSRLEKSP